MTDLPIYQPEDIDGSPLGSPRATIEEAWASAIGAFQVTDLLWKSCVFDVANDARAKRQARYHEWWGGLEEV